MRFLYWLFLFLPLAWGLRGQPSQLSFRKLTVADGLNNGHIQAIGQDARGFLWLASAAGLNRFDGNEIKSYTHIAGDTTTLPPSLVRCIATDSAGRLLAGHEAGLIEYDERLDRFRRIHALDDVWVADILPIDRERVFLATFSGLVAYNPRTRAALYLNKETDTTFGIRMYAMKRRGQHLYIGSSRGLLQYDLRSGALKKIDVGPVSGMRVLAVAEDAGGQLWVAGSGTARLVRLSKDLRSCTVFDSQIASGQHIIFNFADMKGDRKGRIWLATQLDGLLLYNPASGSFERFGHDPQKVWTPSTHLHYTLFYDRDGILWVGGNNGVNYVNPDKTLFHIITPFDRNPDTLSRRIARVAAEDRRGNLWFGTMDGVVRYNPAAGRYKEWNNRQGRTPVIHYNSVRGVLCDEEDNVWIATGGGINKYLQSTGRMIFYGEADSIPRYFYFSVDSDREGRVWFGTRDGDGFYYYEPADRKFYSIRRFAGLAAFAGQGGRKLLQDSRGRYWLGFNGGGVGMYDPHTGRTYHWMASTGKQPGIAGNIVVDIREDRHGVIWISTFHGLSGIEPSSLAIRNYNTSNGLINNSVSALAVDALNRLWIGTGSGLMMLDSSRRYFSSFGMQHGLPSIEMPEHAGATLRNGDIIMPTQNGYFRFDPMRFVYEAQPLTPVITSLVVGGRPVSFADKDGIALKHADNSFRLGFTAINYEAAEGTWYAYKLEGLDEDWTYTRNRFADYSRIPGGDYVFHIKASGDRDHWTGNTIAIPIHVDTIFYKTWWFYLLLAAGSLGIVYGIYRYRLGQQREVLELKGKAQLLEKEKALALYEGLKQQLNPHFLFNSLTSLSGLIETDQVMAGHFLKQMSKIYRYILKSRDNELVTLYEEMNFVQVYIDLQQTRFRNGLVVNMAPDEEARYFKIVPVTLQNMVENAIKHNVIDQESPLVVDIVREDDYLVVRNNLQKKSVIESSNRQGLASLQSLYRYLTRKPVRIEETDHYFTIKIPLI